ncbi:7TM diverse intracellular signaling domain-containing protein [Malaciobacter pacificus]|uniref:histidine kinase n=1 Tax=Malaciobacter pacificus TaxID=1080223 RepID=A0A5C2H6W7_9BACT|nr:7TM diverse intracellular signaling domain-containing protein [Malaciobacter pacificus]QEP34049.1 7TMR-DISM-7TM/7TMR-DISMED2 domain-containing two-component system sensor histidine kinase [Malaciobacter pacificus]
MKIKLFIFFIFCVNFLFANVIEISKLKNTNILNQIEIYIDKNSKKDFKEIINSPTLFTKYDKEHISLGYTKDTVWLKFKIFNDLSNTVEKKLEIDNTMLDEVILYEKIDKDHFIEYKNGVFYRKEFNSLMRYNFDINLKPNEIKEYFLKIKSETSSSYFYLNLYEEKEFLKKDINYQLILTLFFGAMLALIIYNLIIFYFTKEMVYFYYVGNIFFLTISHISFTSMNLHFLPVAFEHIDAYLTIYYIIFNCIFVLLFTKEFLELKKYRYINILISTFISINLILIPFSFISNEYILDLVTYFSLIILITVFFSSIIIAIKEKSENAKYFTIAWGIYIFGYVMLGFKQMNLWSLIDYFPYTFELCCFIEGMMFSIILAKKLNKTKELEISLNNNKVLLKELHHRIKNNMQFIMIMYKMKLEKFTNEQIDKKLDEVEMIIQAICKTHEILYTQENLYKIDTKIYFKELIEKIKESYETKNIKISSIIEVSLDLEKSIYLGIIINELVINSLKYAFSNNKGEINIILKKDGNKTIFIYKDNGKGFDYNQKKEESFGLTFIESIIQNELKGSIKVESQDKLKVTIEI